MKKLVVCFAVLILFAQGAFAVSSDLLESYSPKETMIGKFSSDVLSISEESVRVLKDGHIEVAFEYGVQQLGNEYYIWLVAPQNPGSYTLEIQDVVAWSGGFPDWVTYEKVFSVSGDLVDYSINPGFIFASDDFEISAVVYGGSQTISVDFPESREVNLVPGVNDIDFSIESILGVQFVTIAIGRYSVPVYVIAPESRCGDGLITGDEVCDGVELGGVDCSSMGEYTGGSLLCLSNCGGFDTGLCEGVEDICDSEHLDLCLTSETCLIVGGFWYDEVCNRYEEDSECDSGHLGLCLTHGTCLDAGGFWYDGVCNEEQEVEVECGDGVIGGSEVCDCGDDEVCSSSELNQSDCASVSGEFIGGNLSCSECLSFNVSECVLEVDYGPLNFVFDPRTIRSTVLFLDDASYSFKITNLGGGPVSDIELDYDRERFLISPDENISLGVGESVDLELTIWNVTANKVQGAVVASSGDFYDYMLFFINFTNNEVDVGTEYDDSPSYRCSELGGIFCTAGEFCSVSEVLASDGAGCCVGGICEEESSDGSNSWIGYMIAGIIIIVLVILYLKYKKTGSGNKNPLKTRVSGIEKKSF